MVKVFLVAWGVLATSVVAAHAVTQDAPGHGEPWVREARMAVGASAAPRRDDADARLDAAAVMG